jgi:DNA mismatch repair protein MutS
VGAWDFIAMQQSTFMVEMIEVANILNNATAKSLIILDEVGRGTSTYDGMALAWAITEFLHQNSHCAGKTLFATHYHQLNQLAEYYPRIKNYQFAVKRKGQEILFLHKILSGGTDRSYGVEVARLAGLPQTVVTRAKEILDVFEGAETPTVLKSKRLPTGKPQLTQLTLFDINELNSSKSEGLDTMEELSPKRILGDKIIDELKNMNLDHMTPLDALNKLHELKNKLNDEDRA